MTYMPGVYKIYMVRMVEIPDELANVRLYSLTISNWDSYPLRVLCGMSKSLYYESPIIVTGYYQTQRGIARA